MKISYMATICVAVFSGAVFAAPVQYTTASVEINAQPSADYLGKLDIATPVTVLEKKGNKVKVRVNGWALVEYPSQIFSQAGVRIQYAEFDEESAVKFNEKSERQTVQDNEWVKASAEGWIDAKALTQNVDALWQKGKARLSEACSSCHGAPQADHFTANQWASQLPLKGGRAGHSSAGANALMFKYLQTHAKK